MYRFLLLSLDLTLTPLRLGFESLLASPGLGSLDYSLDSEYSKGYTSGLGGFGAAWKPLTDKYFI